jgi:hypothetical protein
MILNENSKELPQDPEVSDRILTQGAVETGQEVFWP